jgi:hypothetical protein
MTSPARAAACRQGIRGALATLFGIVLSGPPVFVWLRATHPQPDWRDAETFARHFHRAQTIPYVAGVVLVSGYVLLLAALHQLASEERKAASTAALVFTGAFATLVFFNYVVQTTFVPSLVRRYSAVDASLIAALSMSNPLSLGWAIEMWAWGFLGVATWLVAPSFSGGGLERATRACFVANGVTSVGSAAWASVDPAWMMTAAGLVCFAVWNTLVFGMSILAALSLRKRLSGLVRSTETRLPWPA